MLNQVLARPPTDETKRATWVLRLSQYTKKINKKNVKAQLLRVVGHFEFFWTFCLSMKGLNFQTVPLPYLYMRNAGMRIALTFID